MDRRRPGVRARSAWIALSLLAACGDAQRNAAGATATSAGPPPALASAAPLPRLEVSGNQLVDSATRVPVQLRGVVMTSGVWLWDPANPSNGALPNVQFMQQESDFANVAAWGANVVSVYLNWNWFQTSDGWAWLDQTLDWARSHGLYVIPSMVTYPVTGQRGGALFWSNAEARSALARFWTDFAARYKGRTEIVGLDITNEPQGTSSAEIASYQLLLIDQIRSIDPAAVVFVEPVFGAGYRLMPLDRPQLVYDFHFYDPFAFTGQGFPWVAGGNAATDTHYPGDLVSWLSEVWKGEPLIGWSTAPSPQWTTIQWSADVRDMPADADYAMVQLLGEEAGDPDTDIWFDDVQVKLAGSPAYQPVTNGSFEEAGFADPALGGPAAHWEVWAGSSNDPTAQRVVRDTATYASGQASARFRGCSKCELVLGDDWIGVGAALPVTSMSLQARVYTSRRWPSGSRYGIGLKLMKASRQYWDRALVHQTLAEYAALAGSAPVFIGEFTPSKLGPAADGQAWTRDVLDWATANAAGWTFYLYREDYPPGQECMALYNGAYGVPTAGAREDPLLLGVLLPYLVPMPAAPRDVRITGYTRIVDGAEADTLTLEWEPSAHACAYMVSARTSTDNRRWSSWRKVRFYGTNDSYIGPAADGGGPPHTYTVWPPVHGRYVQYGVRARKCSDVGTTYSDYGDGASSTAVVFP